MLNPCRGCGRTIDVITPKDPIVRESHHTGKVSVELLPRPDPPPLPPLRSKGVERTAEEVTGSAERFYAFALTSELPRASFARSAASSRCSGPRSTKGWSCARGGPASAA